ncbi:hypothetical protein NVI2019_OHEONHNH_01868 [Providencia alcalifaciens]|nr:hypothetical protein NVI2019_PLFLNFOB_01453 [Providencia alcalifaciens]CAG9420129.1 hypothetical protein NVI2019_OHEONHNH_01868 [Providencia alcalifaciens]CAG9424141.1 hypothetical protein NVI2019_KOLGMIGM_02364 [Providencia alcalifaciens]CAG9424253.1 hypothetical protein NVI2019_NGLDDFDA_02358 [Providencia alcalifaciens]CAG9425145.1 hypothetical protein NVI2019_OGMBKCAO_02364 [Providencia alcalifaciens]
MVKKRQSHIAKNNVRIAYLFVFSVFLFFINASIFSFWKEVIALLGDKLITVLSIKRFERR